MVSWGIMAKTDLPPRRRRTISHVTYIHHVAWGIACVLLLAVVGGLLAYAQSLSRDNESLKGQLASAVAQRSTCSVRGDWKPATTSHHNLTVDGMNRDYYVHTPKHFIDRQYYPLVMLFPGKSASAQTAEHYGFDDIPAIIAYPSPTIGKDGELAWQGAPYSSSADDVRFTESLFERLSSDLCVDKNRTYVVGFSNGGGFVSLLSCKLPDSFSAFMVIAGAMYYPDGGCKPKSPSTLINIHGDNDGTVPYYGSTVRNLPSIEPWVKYRAKEIGCKEAKTSYQNPSLIVTSWVGCNGDKTIQNIRIAGGIHMWGLLPNDQLWQMLSRFSR